MSYAPARLKELEAFWRSKGGVSGGIVGDAKHTRGYHLGRDRLFAPGGEGWSDYSVKYARDKAGLTNAASALDLGRLNGSLVALRKFSAELVALCRADPKARYLIREIIYTVDGKTVQRYSGYDNQIHTGPGNGDLSHLTHTHLSFPRDTEAEPKVWMFAKLLGESDMGLKLYLEATRDQPWGSFGTAKLTSGALARVSDGASVALAAGTSLGTVQKGTLEGKAVVALNHAGELHVADLARVSFTAIAPPSGPADCTAAVAAATAPLKVEIATLKDDLAECAGNAAALQAALDKAPLEERKRIANAERDRILNT